MDSEKKKAVKNDLKVIEHYFKTASRKEWNNGYRFSVQTSANNISTLEIAARYLRNKGYGVELSYGTHPQFRCCYGTIYNPEIYNLKNKRKNGHRS